MSIKYKRNNQTYIAKIPLKNGYEFIASLVKNNREIIEVKI